MKAKTSRGEVFHIDDIDADLVQRPWYRDERGYIARSVHIRKAKNSYTSRKVYLHTEIARRMFGEVSIVDHRDRDKSNNSRSNLRLASFSSNMSNMGIKSHNTSGFIGVRWDSARQAFRAAVTFDKRIFFVGRFSSAEEAAWMRDQWALELHGEFASLNFDYA